MKKHLFLIIILLTLSKQALACICSAYDEPLVKEMIGYSDIIFIGKVIGSDNWNPYVVEMWDKERRGSDVIIQVESVIKGNIKKNDLIFVYQSAGSCTESFEYGSTHLIFGNRILKIHQLEEKLDSSTELPPPGPDESGLQEEGVYKTNADGEPIDFLRKQIQKYTVIDTDMCRSFLQNSNSYNKVISYIDN
ncbi:hypothetical protein MNBD_BACTEROID06-552 [hydrothermal vent metagenome]|uniref:Uncharacterized protein n=1 Tax=hydrothermal vent metagenome TaxID=652676 RepID=A0A3B0UQD0_9ZZZZ